MGKLELLLDSITDARENVLGRIVICGSHGGLYPAAIASTTGVRAAVFNDAGMGFENAGVGGVIALDRVGMAAAAVDCASCHIGSAKDAYENGVISFANETAVGIGVEIGQTANAAMDIMKTAPQPIQNLDPIVEARQVFRMPALKQDIQLLDSASLVGVEDIGKIVVTGSHGGLIGGNPDRALKAKARIAVFNDAGFGKDDIGVSRLPALELKGVAAVTIDCMTARIGDAASALETGIISAANPLAELFGAKTGRALKDWFTALA